MERHDIRNMWYIMLVSVCMCVYVNRGGIPILDLSVYIYENRDSFLKTLLKVRRVDPVYTEGLIGLCILLHLYQ